MNKYKFSPEIISKIKPLQMSDNWHGILGLLYDYVVIAMAIFLSKIIFLFYPISVLIIGSRQRALATLLHDATHLRLAKNKTINYLLGTFCSGYLIFQEFDSYRQSHIKYHHAQLGNADYDPDYNYYLQSGLYKKRSKRDFFIQYILKPLLLLNTFSYVKYLIENRAATFNKYPKQTVVMLAYLGGIIYTNIYFGIWSDILLYWAVPFLSSFVIIGWFIELAEHYPLVGKFENEIMMTRNRHSHWIEGLFLSIHKENYHLVHHLKPDVPYWNVGKVHELMLLDETYKSLDEKSGGIFYSSNLNKPLIIQWINGAGE